MSLSISGSIRSWSAAMTALVFAGCATVETKDVVADSGKYMAENFMPAQLAPRIRAPLEHGERLPARFRTMHVTYSIDEETEGKKETVTANVDLTNLGNGYIQIRNELSKNAISYRINLALSMGGVYRVKTQTLFLGRTNGLLPMEMKDLTRFDRDLMRPAPGRSYAIESTTGTSKQLMNFVPENMTCTAGEVFPASKVAAGLAGDALDLACNVVGLNNVIVYKSRFSWLLNYGVGLQREIVDSRVKSSYSVTAVVVQQ